LLALKILPFRTARGAKVELARQGFASYGDRIKIVNVDDVAIDDISEHLKGVTAVIHTAAPLTSRGDAKFILKVSFIIIHSY
jgi:nucleoside-diphosphate-sugar epimerase